MLQNQRITKDVILRIGLVYKNPTKIQMLKLSNAVFVGKDNFINNVVSIGKNVEEYRSESWLENMDVLYKLSLDEWDVVKSRSNYY